MKRNAFSLKVKEGKKLEFRSMIGDMWSELTEALDKNDGANFSMWQIENIVFTYYETSEDNATLKSALKELLDRAADTFEWISDPTKEMRLMYHDFGIVRASKEMIRHRVFLTKLKGPFEEEYKKRHDALVEARGDEPDPGPDSNFSIWNAGGYIMGYDEIDTTMEKDETPEDHEATVAWETKMLEIMEWLTDDVDWLTGEHHGHVVRIGYHS